MFAHREQAVPTPTSTEDTFSADGDGASQSRSRSSEIAGKAAAAIGERKDAFAEGIQSAASTLHGRADRLPGGEKVARAAHTTAEAMERAADYMRDQDVEEILSDAQQLVKRHPGAALLTAAAVGFLLARAFSRD
jgi:hypothetical protein